MNIALAESLARKVHATYVRSLPVDPMDIAVQLGIDAKEIPFETLPEYSGCSGVAYINEGQRFILVNSSDAVTRRRFTAAHELGHHVLGHTESGKKFRDTLKPTNFEFVRDPLEVEANQFAAELLMPASLVIAAFRVEAIPTLAAMASSFGVSEEAMKNRLKKLRLI